MKKQIIERGYATYALTNDKSHIYGLNRGEHISKWHKEGMLYWSEVYCEPTPSRGIAVILRKGTLLVGKTDEELTQLHEQSKVNLSND